MPTSCQRSVTLGFLLGRGEKRVREVAACRTSLNFMYRSLVTPFARSSSETACGSTESILRIRSRRRWGEETSSSRKVRVPECRGGGEGRVRTRVSARGEGGVAVEEWGRRGTCYV